MNNFLVMFQFYFFRFLKHNNVAEFLGLHRAHIGFPALIYSNKMRTLRQFLKIRGRDGKERVRIFQETVKGLEYLHRRRLVHMELNTHTVTVRRTFLHSQDIFYAKSPRNAFRCIFLLQQNRCFQHCVIIILIVLIGKL